MMGLRRLSMVKRQSAVICWGKSDLFPLSLRGEERDLAPKAVSRSGEGDVRSDDTEPLSNFA